MSRWSLFFIMIFLAVPQVGIDLYLPSTPSMVIALHTTMTMVQLTLAVYTIGIGVSQLIYGPVSDSIGRKPIIIFGSLVFIVGSLICCLTNSIDLFLAGRVIQGVGIGFGAALSRAILRDLCHDKKKMAKIVSYQSMTWSTVPLLAPIIGGYIQHYSYWRVNFIVLFAIGILIFVLAWFRFSETRLEEQRTPLHLGNTLRGYFSIIRRFSDFSYMLVIAIQFGGVLTIVQMSPFIFQTQLGYSASSYGWFIFVVGFGSLVGSFINRSISQRYPLDHIIISAIGFAFVMALVMNLLAIEWFNAWVIVIPILLIRFAGGLTYSNCITQGMHRYPEKAGSVGALYGTTTMIGASLISSIVAHLPHNKQISLSAALLVQFAISMALFSFIFIKKRHNSKDIS